MTVHDLARSLPSPATLLARSRALAMLDAILSPDRADRYHSFDSRWSATEQPASMRDGCGDEYGIVFSPDGVFVRGFAHESRIWTPSPWPRTSPGSRTPSNPVAQRPDRRPACGTNPSTRYLKPL